MITTVELPHPSVLLALVVFVAWVAFASCIVGLLRIGYVMLYAAAASARPKGATDAR